jgi:hypothetical protein
VLCLWVGGVRVCSYRLGKVQLHLQVRPFAIYLCVCTLLAGWARSNCALCVVCGVLCLSVGGVYVRACVCCVCSL